MVGTERVETWRRGRGLTGVFASTKAPSDGESDRDVDGDGKRASGTLLVGRPVPVKILRHT